MAALRFEVQGIVGGEPRIVVEHVTRLPTTRRPNGRSRWGTAATASIVTGNPSYTCDVQMMGDDGDHNTGGSSPRRCASSTRSPPCAPRRPGCSRPLDLPLHGAKGLMPS